MNKIGIENNCIIKYNRLVFLNCIDKLRGGEKVNSANVSGYSKKTKSQLLKAIDECQSLSQLFALIQHEEIVIQMHTQSGASNLTPKTLGHKEIIDKKDTPFERLKAEVRKSVENGGERQSGRAIEPIELAKTALPPKPAKTTNRKKEALAKARAKKKGLNK